MRGTLVSTNSPDKEHESTRRYDDHQVRSSGAILHNVWNKTIEVLLGERARRKNVDHVSRLLKHKKTS